MINIYNNQIVKSYIHTLNICSTIFGMNNATNKSKQKGVKLTIIALSIWKCRTAPVFDVARHLLLVEVLNKKIIDEFIVKLPLGSVLEKAMKLQQLGIEPTINSLEKISP